MQYSYYRITKCQLFFISYRLKDQEQYIKQLESKRPKLDKGELCQYGYFMHQAIFKLERKLVDSEKKYHEAELY